MKPEIPTFSWTTFRGTLIVHCVAVFKINNFPISSSYLLLNIIRVIK